MSEWTTEIPKEAGWYWWKGNDTLEILYVTKFEKGLHAYVDGDFYRIERLGGEWWPEPIEPPKENK